MMMIYTRGSTTVLTLHLLELLLHHLAQVKIMVEITGNKGITDQGPHNRKWVLLGNHLHHKWGA